MMPHQSWVRPLGGIIFLAGFYTAIAAAAAPSLLRTAASDGIDQVTLAATLEGGSDAEAARASALYCRAALRGNRTAIIHLVGLLLADPSDDAKNAAAAAWLHRLQYLQHGIVPPHGPVPPPCPSGTVPATHPELAVLADGFARDLRVDDGLVRAVIAAESSWRPDAVSPKGALGLMQIMPDNLLPFAVSDPFDPAQNIHAGTAEIGRLLGVFAGNVPLALAAYNAGQGVVSRCMCVPENGETPGFVARVRSLMDASGSGNDPHPADPFPRFQASLAP